MKRLSLNQFLEKYSEPIRRHVIEEFRPRYTQCKRGEFSQNLSSLKRRPFSAQVDAIAGLTLGLKEKSAAFLVGEMGCGKTGISVAVAYLLGIRNTLILCPPHLVRKWEKEIRMTLPSCDVVQVRSMTGLRESYDSPSVRPRFFILSRERAKLSYHWKPAVLSLRRMMPVEEGGKTRTRSIRSWPVRDVSPN